MKQIKVAIIGAGPAGMSAAAVLSQHSIPHVVLDEQNSPGGQIYRAITTGGLNRAHILGKEYLAGIKLGQLLQKSTGDKIYNASIWRVDKDGTLTFSTHAGADQLRADYILLATGAQERPYPFNGWTLPGVMTAGAAQILLKAHSLVVKEAVLAGNGPLLYLLASQLIKAGYPPKAILETRTNNAWKSALPHLPAALLQGKRYLWKGIQMLAEIKRARIPHYVGIKDLQASGHDVLDQVSFTHRGNRHTINTQSLLAHQGVIPNTHMTRSLNLPHHWDEIQKAWRPSHDIWGGFAGNRIFVAGDGAGIGGALAASLSGELSALQISTMLGKLSESKRDVYAKTIQLKLKQELAVRPFLDRLYAADYHDVLTDDAITVCRCEEVTAGMLRSFVKLGCLGLNQTKAYSRCGMGPCQGRMCGDTAMHIIASERNVPPQAVDYFRIRAPIKPVTLNELASLANERALPNSDETSAY